MKNIFRNISLLFHYYLVLFIKLYNTLLKTLEKFSIEEISDKEATELCCCTKMTATDIAAPPMYGDVFLPNDYEKPTNFEKHRTTR